jgi:diguanylate cyclase (GGDEF)-like protein/PAS domain S-box-containing protein
MSSEKTIRVLVVEDSPSQARRLRSVLEDQGFIVETASDGIEGLQAFQLGAFDLILSDVLMPRLSGYDLCHRIKADSRGRRTPFVLLTGLSKPIDLIRGIECGADNYIYKPFEAEALLSRIRTILRNKEARKSANASGESSVVFFMGHRLEINSSREQILDYLGSTYEDFVDSRNREYENALARQQQIAQAETFKVREEMLHKEKETLARTQSFLQSTLDALPIRIAILDASGTILSVNAAWRRLTGSDPLTRNSCEVGVNYLHACESRSNDPQSPAALVAEGIRDVMAQVREEYSKEYSSVANGEGAWYNVRITRFGDTDSVRVVVAHEDITSRKAAEAQLLHEASHDVLTGLPNRAHFTERLGRAVTSSKQQHSDRFAVLFLDLDGFKVVNDSLGHMAGDQLLIEIGQRLGACIRSTDVVARLGGDEFAILLNDIRDVNDALKLVTRIQDTLSVPFRLVGHEVFTSASIGIAVNHPRYDRPVEILRDADTAMYRAKAVGKAHHLVFDQAMHTSAVERLKLETDLRRAVEREEFLVVYQPILEIDTEQLVGFEALVRWMHPTRGLIQPSEFIPAAEETGLIIPLDLWVICRACRQMMIWQDLRPGKPPLTLSVNLSGKQFAQGDLVQRLDSVIDETGFDPRSLRLEITESVIMGHPESTLNKLRHLERRGFCLSMDDFGTGYSSLSYLHRFPFNMIKIDRSFVRRIGPAGENSEIVATIVALAHNLGMRVVAEGVETPEQAAQLRALHCQYGQGYYYSRPLPVEEAEAFMNRRSPHDDCLQSSSTSRDRAVAEIA